MLTLADEFCIRKRVLPGHAYSQSVTDPFTFTFVFLEFYMPSGKNKFHEALEVLSPARKTLISSLYPHIYYYRRIAGIPEVFFASCVEHAKISSWMCRNQASVMYWWGKERTSSL